jgi:hypothetical protein
MTVCKSISSPSSTDYLSSKLSSKMAIKRSSDPAIINCSQMNSIKLDISRSYSDECIQSTGSRRRYMRRGSRAPSMFAICLAELEKHDTDNNIDELMGETTMYPRKQRRLSLTASLHKQLGELSLGDKGKVEFDHVKLDTNQYLKMQRRFSYNQAITASSDVFPYSTSSDVFPYST